jgi:ubiquinone/menaquinone biosynthesis C-methylase UbiE
MHNNNELEWTGERYVPQIRGTIALEHLHRYAFACEHIKGLDVLDIASGEGYGSEMLSRSARHVYGVDIDKISVFHARSKYQHKNLTFLQGSCTNIPLEDSSVDVVVSFETIEHINDHAKMMNEVKRVLRPEGTLIISSPEKSVYENINHQANPYHLKELSHVEFSELLGNHFKHTALFGQRVLFGSALIGIGGNSPLGRTYEFSSLPQKIKFRTGLPKSVYIVAICSDHLINNQTGSFCEQNISENELFVNLLKKATDQEDIIKQLHSKVAKRNLRFLFRRRSKRLIEYLAKTYNRIKGVKKYWL